jgi:hypothetical protein
VSAALLAATVKFLPGIGQGIPRVLTQSFARSYNGILWYEHSYFRLSVLTRSASAYQPMPDFDVRVRLTGMSSIALRGLLRQRVSGNRGIMLARERATVVDAFNPGAVFEWYNV